MASLDRGASLSREEQPHEPEINSDVRKAMTYKTSSYPPSHCQKGLKLHLKFLNGFYSKSKLGQVKLFQNFHLIVSIILI